MKNYEKRMKRLEQQNTQDDEKPLSPEMIRLIEELRGEKMSEEEKRQPQKQGPIDTEIKEEIDFIISHGGETRENGT